MGLRCAGRDDANNFFVVFLIVRVNDQKNGTRPDGPNRHPAFLIVMAEITLRHGIRILKRQNRSFKTNIMLIAVPTVLALIPFKSHGVPPQTELNCRTLICQYVCAYNTGHGIGPLKLSWV